MTDARRSSSQLSSLAPHGMTAQLRQANRQLSVVSQELEVTTEQLRAAQAQLRTYQEQLRRYAADLQQSQQTAHRLDAELTLLNAGLVDTIADSLQATEFARAEAEAKHLHLHRLLAEAPTMIAVLVGPDHVVELANNQLRALLGSREVVGQPLCQAVPELAGQPLMDQLAEVYRTGKTYVATDAPVMLGRTQSGPLAHLLVTCELQATRDEAGHIDGLAIFAHEVTEQVKARQALEAHYQHLARTNDELDTFVYAASHDLQGPLNNICGLLQILCGALSTADQPAQITHVLNLLHDSAGRFQHTLTQLSTIARAQAEASQPAALFVVADVVQGVLLDLALPIAEAGAQLTVEIADCPLVSLAEKTLRSVVYNLLSNAIKYRHPNRVPQICVRGRLEAGFWVLEVQDNGLGLALPAGESTFTLFQRFSTHVDGAGVGLYLVQKLVERDGGRLEVRSQLGQGATFTIYFNCQRVPLR